MSKGTKQIRLGRVERLLRELEVRRQALEDTRKMSTDEGLLVRIDEIEKTLKLFKEEFGL